MLSTYDVARSLHISTSTVRRWIQQGRLKATQYTPRGPLYIEQKDLDSFMESVHSKGEKIK